MIQIYTGDGKGKTTAALGLAFRALGKDLRVQFVQFLKKGGCGEHISAHKLGLPIHCACIQEAPWNPTAAQLWQEDTKVRFAQACHLIDTCDLLICDELLGAMNKGYVSQEQVLQLIASARQATIELVITGRGATQTLMDAADLVTQMQCIKHYMDAGIGARDGIEW